MKVFLEVLAALFAYKIWNSKPVKENTTIGVEKVVDGIRYWNLGTLENEDDWVSMGNADISYYVNVYDVGGEIRIKVEEESNEEAIDSRGIYNYDQAPLIIEFYERVYKKKGNDNLHYDGE